MTTSKLNAFAPTGAAIKDTFECATGTHGVAFFYKDGDTFVHEFSDDYSTNDQETVSINGDTLYVDANWKTWPLAALTFKTASGKVVRKGQDILPIDVPGFDFALTLGFQAEKLAAGKSELVEQDWINTVNAQNWDDSSQVLHLEGFIRDMGLMPSFAAYAARAAKEENVEVQDDNRI